MKHSDDRLGLHGTDADMGAKPPDITFFFRPKRPYSHETGVAQILQPVDAGRPSIRNMWDDSGHGTHRCAIKANDATGARPRRAIAPGHVAMTPAPCPLLLLCPTSPLWSPPDDRRHTRPADRHP
jgi:hypothetical protein